MGKRRKGFGKLKEGSLTKYGYHLNKSARARHRALNKALKRYGYTKLVHKLGFLAGPARLTPSEKKKVKSDIRWLREHR